MNISVQSASERPQTGDPAVGSTRLVLRVDRSPMNALRWCCELECGHEVWITSKRRPSRSRMKCSKCATQNAAGEPQPRKPRM
jgi:hypothetical protein